MEDQKTTKDRFLSFLEVKGVSKNACERQIGASTGFLSKETTEFSTDSLRKFSRLFPDLDIMWLIFGEDVPCNTGDRIEHNAGDVFNRSHIPAEVMAEMAAAHSSIRQQLDVKDTQLKAKDEQLAAKDTQIASLHATIDSLLGMIRPSHD